MVHSFLNCLVLKQWLISLNIQVFEWTIKDILLGVIGENPAINHIIIISKYYIYRQSIIKKKLSLNNLINTIRRYYQVEKQISKAKNNTNVFLLKWSNFVNVFENPL